MLTGYLISNFEYVLPFLINPCLNLCPASITWKAFIAVTRRLKREINFINRTFPAVSAKFHFPVYCVGTYFDYSLLRNANWT